jgi:hypothetical protein
MKFSSLLLFFLAPLSCEALSSSTIVKEFPTVSLKSADKSQLAILDGAEWASVQGILRKEKRLSATTKYGYMKVVTGRNEDNERVIAMQSVNDNENVVYKDSMAVIPSKISEADAISTYVSSLCAIHAVLPKAEQVGGSDETIVAGKVVVMGSSEFACFAAEGLASLGADVCLVSPGNPKVRTSVGNCKSSWLFSELGVMGRGYLTIFVYLFCFHQWTSSSLPSDLRMLVSRPMWDSLTHCWIP